MCVVIYTDVLYVGQIVKIKPEHLTIERRRFIVKVLMVEVVEGFFHIIKNTIYIWHHSPSQYRSQSV